MKSKRVQGKIRATFGVRPVAEYTIQAEYADVVQQCTEAVRSLRRVRSWNADTVQGVITASVGMSLISWGEYIRIDVRPAGESVNVRITSTPKVPVTLVDYGKNLRNVEGILRQLNCGFAVGR